MNMWELPLRDSGDPSVDPLNKDVLFYLEPSDLWGNPADEQFRIGEQYCDEHDLSYKHFCPDCVAEDNQPELLFDCA